MSSNPVPDVPTFDGDLFADDALVDPYPLYATLRATGPVVWLEQLEMFALPRDAESRQALLDDSTFCSGQGVGLNPTINEIAKGTTLMSDGELHDRFRRIVRSPMTPGAVRSWQPDVLELAREVVGDLVGRGPFDAMTLLVNPLPLKWVPDLLGWPHEKRDRLLDWGASGFDVLGPMNERARRAEPQLIELAAYATEVAAERKVDPAGIAHGILDALDRGDVTAEQCPGLMIDYLGPSIDTTISGISNAVWLFAEHPDQWQLLRAHPDLVPNAFNEVLRLEAPLSCMTRVATADVEIGGTTLPAGARVLIMYASANRDERQWDRPDEFDITREHAGMQLAFGVGAHACAGMAIARLEGHAILEALVERVERIEPAGTPLRRLNNVIRTFASLPVELVG